MMIKNIVSTCAKPFVAASNYVGAKVKKPASSATITKTASRKDDDNNRLREWFWGLVIAASCGLGGWALKSTVDIYAEMKEEKALRASKDDSLDQRLTALKQDMQKAIDDVREDTERRLAEYKAENERRAREARQETDRRFGEIQKQLELLNNKLDRLLTRPIP